MPAQSVAVLVIGAGQAGLAAGYWLRRRGLSFQIVDRAGRVGDSWRKRWDSLTLFTPAAYSALPGLALGGDQDAYPTKDEMADYLERYAARFELPLRLNTAVTCLRLAGDGFVASLSGGDEIIARAVIVATGPFQRPAVPALAAGLADDVVQLTPDSYRNPADLPAGSVLIVGDGATGRQIALELAARHDVLLATGRPRRVLPERILGRSIFWWLDRLGLLRASRTSRIGRWLMERDPFPGRGLRLGQLSRQGVSIRPRVETLAGRTVTFADGAQADVATVIWSTGYRDETGWLAVPGAASDGRFIQDDGMSPVPGMYYVGRSWQRTRGSALVLGAGEDARLIVDLVLADAPRQPTARAGLQIDAVSRP